MHANHNVALMATTDCDTGCLCIVGPVQSHVANLRSAAGLVHAAGSMWSL